MINNNSFYKSTDLLNDNKRIKIKEYFNPYEFNFESNLKDRLNSDIECQKTKCIYNNKLKRK